MLQLKHSMINQVKYLEIKKKYLVNYYAMIPVYKPNRYNLPSPEHGKVHNQTNQKVYVSFSLL